jgi:uncharacterized protein (TIGR01777 family)
MDSFIVVAMDVGITGASGFIGRKLTQVLASGGHRARRLARRPSVEELTGCQAVVHLAGEPIAQRWTPAAKARIRDSRIEGTRHLVQTLEKVSARPGVLVCSSAIGIYGDRRDEILTESSTLASGFLAEVCRAWEAEAVRAESLGMRVVRIRTGVVLGRGGGALAKMLPPFRAFVGGKLGSGQQWMSWIHLDDLAGLIRFALDQPIHGPLNGVAPNPVRNEEFTRELARALHRPAILPAPSFAVKTLFGEMSEVVLGSQRVLPKAAGNAGYRFQYPQLAGALREILP